MSSKQYYVYQGIKCTCIRNKKQISLFFLLMCWESPLPAPTPSIPPPLVALHVHTMNPTNGIEWDSHNEGEYGFVVKIHGNDGKTYAVKVFKQFVDSELALLGVKFNFQRRTCTLEGEVQHRMQTLLFRAGFVPTLLREENSTCAVCRCLVNRDQRSRCTTELGECAKKMLAKHTHYHVYMPFHHGTLNSLFRKTPFSIEQRICYFFQISKVSKQLSTAGILNTDLKPSNILYSNIQTPQGNQLQFFPCDVGGLAHVNQECVEQQFDTFVRYIVYNPRTQTRRFIGQVDEFDETQYAPPSGNETSTKLRWCVATYVNPYLLAEGVKNNFDLSDTTHLTNQFSLLALFMYMVHISPPTHTLVKNKAAYQHTLSKFPTMEAYIEAHTQPRLLQHRLCKPILDFVHTTWKKCSNWELLGDENSYIQNMEDAIKQFIS